MQVIHTSYNSFLIVFDKIYMTPNLVNRSPITEVPKLRPADCIRLSRLFHSPHEFF